MGIIVLHSLPFLRCIYCPEGCSLLVPDLDLDLGTTSPSIKVEVSKYGWLFDMHIRPNPSRSQVRFFPMQRRQYWQLPVFDSLLLLDAGFAGMGVSFSRGRSPLRFNSGDFDEIGHLMDGTQA